MADNTVSGLSDLLISPTMALSFTEMLDNNQDLRSLCAVKSGLGQSAAVKFPALRTKYTMANAGESTATTDTAFVDDSGTATMADLRVGFNISHLAAAVDTLQFYTNADTLARMCINSGVGAAATLITAQFTNFTDSAGTSGQPTTVQDVLNLYYKLKENNGQGPYSLVVHPIQFSHFHSDLMGYSGNALQVPATEILKAKNPGYQGNWMGIDIYEHDSCAASGADRIGALMCPGAVGLTEAPPNLAIQQGAVILAGVFAMQLSNAAADVREGQTLLEFSYKAGTCIFENPRGAKLVSVGTL